MVACVTIIYMGHYDAINPLIAGPDYIRFLLIPPPFTHGKDNT